MDMVLAFELIEKNGGTRYRAKQSEQNRGCSGVRIEVRKIS